MAVGNVYSYKQLSPGRIRILILKPSTRFEDRIECTLHEATLGVKPRQRISYEAVSYVWGSPVGDQEIFCDGKIMLVTRNCLSALRHFRRKRGSRALWVDAICIDQLSNSEKNHQVSLMGDIYALARKVLIWLGEENSEAQVFMRKLRWYGVYLKWQEKTKIFPTLEFNKGTIGHFIFYYEANRAITRG